MWRDEGSEGDIQGAQKRVTHPSGGGWGWSGKASPGVGYVTGRGMQVMLALLALRGLWDTGR